MVPKFFKVEKNGEHLVVHETTLDAHIAAGWKLIGEVPAPGFLKKGKKDEDPTPENDQPPAE